MRVPVYEEIKITKYDVMNVLDVMKKSRVGKAPTYIDLNDKNQDETLHCLDIIHDALKVMKTSPVFPYPLYLITPFKDIESELPLVFNKSDLPKHFMKPVKRLTSKELNLLNKSVTLSERISNTSLSQRQAELKSGIRYYKMLYQLTKELDFYQGILENLSRPKRRS